MCRRCQLSFDGNIAADAVACATPPACFRRCRRFEIDCIFHTNEAADFSIASRSSGISNSWLSRIMPSIADGRISLHCRHFFEPAFCRFRCLLRVCRVARAMFSRASFLFAYMFISQPRCSMFAAATPPFDEQPPTPLMMPADTPRFLTENRLQPFHDAFHAFAALLLH